MITTAEGRNVNRTDCRKIRRGPEAKATREGPGFSTSWICLCLALLIADWNSKSKTSIQAFDPALRSDRQCVAETATCVVRLSRSRLYPISWSRVTIVAYVSSSIVGVRLKIHRYFRRGSLTTAHW